MGKNLVEQQDHKQIPKVFICGLPLKRLCTNRLLAVQQLLVLLEQLQFLQDSHQE
jgi:hypothetical protein